MIFIRTDSGGVPHLCQVHGHRWQAASWAAFCGPAAARRGRLRRRHQPGRAEAMVTIGDYAGHLTVNCRARGLPVTPVQAPP
jgi:hypothetical protein